jgi:asparagine synthase (glutamine-hydrolysing)
MRLHSIVKLFTRKPATLRTIYRIRKEGLSFLSLQALSDLGLAMLDIQERKVPGIVVEVGVALGGSSILLTSIKEIERPLFLYDTFEMIPPPGDMDGEDAHQRYRVIQSGQAQGLVPGEKYYGYIENLFERVKSSFKDFGFPVEANNVVLIKGLVEETISIEQPIALAHVDCDWYSPVKSSLIHIIPRLSIGGRIIVDDYYHWSGARRAVDELFANYDMSNYKIQHLSRLHIIRNSS